MPSLKDLDCSIELSDNQQALQEFGTIYGDGFVETFVPVPNKPQSFSVHLTSNKFIAPGVAIFVYVDGVYQCNRNRQDLKLRKPSDSRSLVDFRVRQKEEKQKDGSMIAREWTFDKLNITSADDAPNLCSPNILDNIGCIEVIVLRCAGTRSVKSASTMNLDGAGDFSDHHFGLDGSSSPSNERSMYDDRPPFFNNGFGPPPPMPSYRSPYASTIRSHEASTLRSRHNTHASRELSPRASMTRHSRYSEPVSPGARRMSDLPSSGFQYGSGPIPRDGESFQQRPSSAVATNAPGMDPVWLNNVIKTAVKQGVKESRKAETQTEGQERHKQHTSEAHTTSQPPGAWPESPFAAPAQPHRHFESVERSLRDGESDGDTIWGQSQDGWGHRPARSRARTRVTITEPMWETESSSAKGWDSREETPSDSWDTEDTWDTNQANEWEAASQPERFMVTNAPSHFNTRPSSPVTTPTRDRRRSRHSSQQERDSRSRSCARQGRRRHETTSSSEENGDWTNVERPSDSVISMSSSNDTVRPTRSASQVHASHSRSKSYTRRSKSKHRDDERRSSRHSRRTPPTWQPEVTHPPPAPPSITHMVPTVTNGPVSACSTEVRSRKVSGYADQPFATLPPPPGWGPAPTEQLRKSSNATGFMGPAPYASSLENFVKSTLGVDEGGNRSTSSSSWGSDKKAGSARGSWSKTSKRKAGSSDEDNSWGEKKPDGQKKSGWEVKNDDHTDGWGKTDDAKDVEAKGWETTIGVAKDTSRKSSKQSSRKAEKADAADNWDGLKDALTNILANPQIPKTSPAPETQRQDQSWNNRDTTFKPNNGFQWDTTDPWTAAPAADKKPESRRHSNKSLFQYRQHRTPSLSLEPKSHWQFPPLPSDKKLYPICEDRTYIAPKEPRYTISAKTASEKGVEHQVRAGKATEYGHAVGRPEYLDRLDKPYAVFRFKYRSRTILKSLFGDQVPDHGTLVQPKPEEVKFEKEKEKLKDLPQEQLIEKMLKLQGKLEEKEGGRKDSKYRSSKHGGGERGSSDKEKESRKEERRASGQTEVVAKDMTEQWVKQHSRDASEKAKSQAAKSEKKEKKEKKEGKDGQQGWGQNDGWGGGDDALKDVKW